MLSENKSKYTRENPCTDINEVQILDTWRIDPFDLDQELQAARSKVNEIQRKIRKMKKERLLQPPLLVKSLIQGRKRVMLRYHIADAQNGILVEEQGMDFMEESNTLG